MLVHMTPKEVGGLQALAMAHGGSLTINPETGLPEAGFLSSLLPTLIGAGLSIASGGALTPLMAAGLTGAGYGIATGNLGKGLMAGLGAYGGAGLGAGLSAAGTGATFVDDAVMAGGNAAGAQAAGQATANQVIAKQALEEAAKAPFSTVGKGLGALTDASGRSAFMSGMSNAAPYSGMASSASLLGALTPESTRLGGGSQKALIRPYTFERTQNPEAYAPSPTAYSGEPFDSRERNYFTEKFTALDPYRAPGPEYAAGGLTALAVGGPVETMSAENAVGQNLDYPQSQLQTSMYSNPMMQRPIVSDVIKSGLDAPVDQYAGQERFASGGDSRRGMDLNMLDTISSARDADPESMAAMRASGYNMGDLEKYGTGYAAGGISHLGDYSDGGRLLRGPGDGVSDSIPASIGDRRPARLADGEFVVPARIVSELGNGSTEAGARKLYAMMDRVQKARKKSVGQKKVAVDSKAEKLLPA